MFHRQFFFYLVLVLVDYNTVPIFLTRTKLEGIKLLQLDPKSEVGTLSVTSIMLHYVFALSDNALTLWRNVIAFVSYRSEHIGAVIASKSHRSKLLNKRYCFYQLSLQSDISAEYALNTFTQNKIFKNIYFKYYKGSKVVGAQRYSVIPITLRYSFRYR